MSSTWRPMSSLIVVAPRLPAAQVFDGRIYIATFKTAAEAQSFIRRAIAVETGAYWFKFLIGIDMFGAVLLFRDANVTISSLTGLAMRLDEPPRWARALGAFLNWLQADHCELAIVHDIMRLHAARQLFITKGDLT
jgi:hypothetical protein